jgi:hypothetical protein
MQHRCVIAHIVRYNGCGTPFKEGKLPVDDNNGLRKKNNLYITCRKCSLVLINPARIAKTQKKKIVV